MSKEVTITYTVTCIAVKTVPTLLEEDEESVREALNEVGELLTDVPSQRAYVTEEVLLGTFRIKSTEVKITD